MTQLNMINEGYEKRYGFSDKERAVFKTKQGLDEEVVDQISRVKKEPKWMQELRQKALRVFKEKKMPTWGGDLSLIDFDKYTYFMNAAEKTAHSWDDVPSDIKKTFERLGIPEAEQKFLGGVGAQYESQTVYHKLRDDLAKQGIIFTDTDTALQEHPEIF